MKATMMECALHFFGLLPDQTKMQFGKDLMVAYPNGTDARKELLAGLAQNGYEVITNA